MKDFNAILLHKQLLYLRETQYSIHEEVYSSNSIKIPIHFAFGHEAIALAVASSLGPRDKLLLSHRNIHYHLALGASKEELLAEYSLQMSRISGRRLGSMNLDYPSKGAIYTSNILANNLSVATGVAYAATIKNEKSITWCVTGDGAIEEGSFYESLVLASAINSPVIYLVENNRWSLASEISERRKEIRLDSLSKSLGLNYFSFSGNNVYNYANILKKIRENQLPAVIEVNLKTLGGYEIASGTGVRHVNYHAGQVRSGILKPGIIEESNSDPCWVSTNELVDLEATR